MAKCENRILETIWSYHLSMGSAGIGTKIKESEPSAVLEKIYNQNRRNVPELEPKKKSNGSSNCNCNVSEILPR